MTPFQFVTTYIPALGWGTVISFLSWAWWKSLRVYATFESARDRAEVVEKNVNIVATNHLEHIEKDMSELNAKHDLTMAILTESSKSLSEISTNIRILVDRGTRV